MFAALAVLLGACGEPVVSQTMVNHAYDGRTKTLVVYDHLYDGLRARFTTGFDTQFTADMQRCGIAVSIVDSSGVELNWAQHVLQVVRETHADTVLVGNWTRRENHGGASSQVSTFTLAQLHQPHDTTANLGEVWKAEITQGIDGLKLAGPNDGTLMAMRVTDQLAQDRMLLGCKPRPVQPG